MTIGVQITIDARDTRALSGFWALALGYVPEPPPGGYDSWETWAREQGVPPESMDLYAAIVDPDARRPRVLFQKVPEDKAAKNRMHLDVHVGGREMPAAERVQVRDAKVAELVAAGARELARYEEFGSSWVVLQDPEGNEFCVA